MKLTNHLIAALLLASCALAAPAFAQQGISQKVAVCDPSYPTRCMKPAVDGSVVISGSLTPSATPTPITPTPSSAAGSAIVPSVSASATSTSLVAKASAGNYYDGYCKSTVAGNCILYNATAAPAAGALTASLVLECVPILTTNGVGTWAYPGIPRRATVGITLLFSSSTDCNTYTVSPTAYIHASVQ